MLWALFPLMNEFLYLADEETWSHFLIGGKFLKHTQRFIVPSEGMRFLMCSRGADGRARWRKYSKGSI